MLNIIRLWELQEGNEPDDLGDSVLRSSLWYKVVQEVLLRKVEVSTKHLTNLGTGLRLHCVWASFAPASLAQRPHISDCFI